MAREGGAQTRDSLHALVPSASTIPCLGGGSRGLELRYFSPSLVMGRFFLHRNHPFS